VSVLDPTTPYPYLLYTLFGAGVVAYFLPKALEDAPQLLRDTFNARPALYPIAAIVLWTIWPLIFGLFLLALLAGLALRILDSLLKQGDK